MSGSLMDSLAPETRQGDRDDAFNDEFDRLDNASVVSNITFDSINTDVETPNTKVKRTKRKEKKKRKNIRKFGRSKFFKNSNADDDTQESTTAEKTPLYRRMVSNRAQKPQTLAQVKSSNLSVFSDSPSVSPSTDSVVYDEKSVAARFKDMKLVDMQPQVKLTEDQKSNLKKKSITYETMGEASFQQKNYDEAYETYYQLYLSLLSLYGKDDDNVANALVMLAKVDQMRGNNAKVIDALYQEAYRIQVKLHGIYSLGSHSVLEARGAFIATTSLEEGGDILKMLAESQIRYDFECHARNNVNTKKIALLYLKSGELYISAQNYDDAFVVFKRAFKWLRKGNPSDYEKIEEYGTVLYMMGVTCEKIGDAMIKHRDDVFSLEARVKYASAIEYFDEASKIYKRQKDSRTKSKEAQRRSGVCERKRDRKPIKEFVIEADLSELIGDIGLDKADERKRSKGILKRISNPLKNTKKEKMKEESRAARINEHLSENLRPCINYGKDAFAKKDYSTALTEFKKSYTISYRVNGMDSNELGDILEKIAETYSAFAVSTKDIRAQSLDYHDEAISNYSEALRIYRINENNDGSQRVLKTLQKMLLEHNIDDRTYEIMGNNFVKSRKYVHAIDCYRRAYYAKKSVLGEKHIDIAFLLTKMANIEAIIVAHVGMGSSDVNKVTSYFAQALKIIQSIHDLDYVTTLKTMHKASAGEIMFLRGLDEVALQYYSEVDPSTVEKVIGQGCTELVAVWSNLGEIHFSRSNFQAAAKYFDKALKSRKTNDEECGILIHCLALVYEKMGDNFLADEDSKNAFDAYDESITNFEKARDIFRAILGEGHDNVISTLHHMAYLYMKKRDIDKAVPCYLKELNEIRSQKPSDKRIPTIYRLLATAAIKKYDYEAAAKYMEKAVEFSRTHEKSNDDLTSSLHKLIQIYGKMKNYERAITVYKELLHHSSDIGQFEENATVRYKLGKLCVLAGKATEAIGLYEEALPVLSSSIDENYHDIFKTLCYLGDIYFDKGKYVYNKALGCYEGAIKISSIFPDVNQNCLETAMNNTGFIYFSLGDLIKSVDVYKAVMTIHKKTNGDSDKGFATLSNNLANVLLRLGEYDTAKIHHDEACRIKTSLFGNSGEGNGFAQKLGALYMNMDDIDAALKCYNEALQEREAELGNDACEVVELHKQIAKIYAMKEDWGKAKASYQQIISIQSKTNGRDNDIVMFQLGFALFKSDQYEDALKWYESGLRLCNSDEKRATVFNSIGNVYIKQGKYEEALSFYRKSLDLKKIIHGDNNKAVSRTLHNMGIVCQKLGDLNNAAIHLRAALQANKKSKNGDLHPSKVAKTMIDLGKIYYSEKQYTEAKKLFVDAEWSLREIRTPTDDKSLQTLKLCLQRLEAREEKNRARVLSNSSKTSTL